MAQSVLLLHRGLVLSFALDKIYGKTRWPNSLSSLLRSTSRTAEVERPQRLVGRGMQHLRPQRWSVAAQ